MALGLTTSCTTFDDETVMDYGQGPKVNLALVSKSDSAFTFSITPDEGTAYYAFVIDRSATVDSTVSASDLLAGNYGGYTLNTEKDPTFSMPVSVSPNTSYVVYAVGNNDKGVLGQVEMIQVTTTDGVAPFIKAADNTGNQIAVTFDNSIARGTGAFSAFLLKEWDLENPVAIAADSINCEVSAGTATFTFNGIPAGAYVFLNWEKGAFVDAAGNEVAAFNGSNLDLETGEFNGLWYHQDNEAWSIAVSDFIPETGSLISDAASFVATVKFDKNIYVIEDDLANGDIKLTYTSSARTVTYNLPVEQLTVADSSFSFTLPYAGEPNDVVTVSIAEGKFYDVYGNANAAFADSKLSWTVFAPTVDMVLGNFDFLYYSAYDEEPQVYAGDTIVTIIATEEENGVLVKDLYMAGSEFKGRYDLAKGKLYIEPYDVLGLYTNSQGTTYGLVLYSLSYADEIECTINADGTITTTDMGVVAYDETFENALFWWDKFSIAAFSPVQAEASAKAAPKAAKARAPKAARIPNKVVR